MSIPLLNVNGCWKLIVIAFKSTPKGPSKGLETSLCTPGNRWSLGNNMYAVGREDCYFEGKQSLFLADV